MTPTKKTTPQDQQSSEDAVVTNDEKEILIQELKQTAKQLGRLPRLMLAPIISYISNKYDAIPQQRREQLHHISQEIKKNGTSAVDQLKGWFQELTTSMKEKSKKKTTKQATTSKKTAKKTIKKKASTSTTPAKKKSTTRKKALKSSK